MPLMHQEIPPQLPKKRMRCIPCFVACARRAASFALLVAPLALSATSGATAAHDAEMVSSAAITGEQTAPNLQLVVLEAPGCTYCSMFRRYVVPVYQTSPKSRSLPLKFIDLNDKAYDDLGLDSPVDMVPTTVLMQNNREVGRIPGYVGPENFFHAINHLMARVN